MRGRGPWRRLALCSVENVETTARLEKGMRVELSCTRLRKKEY